MGVSGTGFASFGPAGGGRARHARALVLPRVDWMNASHRHVTRRRFDHNHGTDDFVSNESFLKSSFVITIPRYVASP